MPNYNKNSVFAVSNAGTIPNRADDLIFFEDISHEQKYAWDEFERIMATGDYDEANAYAKACADVHGYFSDLYNLMVNRIKAAQNVLILNKTNIDNGTGAFSSFKKPEIFVYQEESDSPKTILRDQVWIGPEDYFDIDIIPGESMNKLKIHDSITNNQPYSFWGLTFTYTEEGYVVINGTCTRPVDDIVPISFGTTLGNTIDNSDIWSWWYYYVSGTISDYKNGYFRFWHNVGEGETKEVVFGSGSTAILHANFLYLMSRNTVIDLVFSPVYGETYNNLTVGFMVCKTAETTPNQKFVKYEGA